MSQCYIVVDSTIFPPSLYVRFITLNVCVSVRSFVLIVSDIAIIRFDSANPPGYFRKVFASCLFLTSQRQGLYPWVPPRLQRLSQSTSCRSNSVTHHHSLEIEDCVLFWLPRGNFICSSCDSAEVKYIWYSLISSPDFVMVHPSASLHATQAVSSCDVLCSSTVE